MNGCNSSSAAVASRWSEVRLQVEVCQSPCSTVRSAIVKDRVVNYLKEIKQIVYGDCTFSEFTDEFLVTHVKSIAICDTELTFGEEGPTISLSQAAFDVHVFQLHDDGPATEDINDQEDDIAAANHWLLPAADFEHEWDNLVYDSNVKEKLLRYASTTLLFSDRKVDTSVITWNRVILLHGPPGTGKTSLCKALAQKLCIRFSGRYAYGQLVEINSHSLFSKWFSESGKLVQKMFAKIQELIDDPDALVCVLIDEVESLTTARKAALAGSEPSDAVRVVNALLTQIDQIKRHSNVLILTTSNMTEAIDLAFVDRADIKQFIGLPSPAAIYKIYQSCLHELMRASIISPAQQLLDLRSLKVMQFVENDATRPSLQLHEIARKSEGLSGRTLRKIPMLAHAMFGLPSTISLEVYLDALAKAVQSQFDERQDMARTSS